MKTGNGVLKVAKFGGTSVADARTIKLSANFVFADSSRKFVVVSAPGKRFEDDQKITDILYACHDAAAEGGDPAPFFFEVEKRFRLIADALKLDELNIDNILREVYADIKSAKKGRGYAASRGEYLSALVMAAYLGYEFVDATEIIKFDDKGFFDAATTDKKARSRLSRVDEGAVIPGFYGCMPDGTVATFSRGGGDITGGIIARAVGAGLYENFTDVDGFLACDPKIINYPRLIEELTYRELRELSYMGASVLHPDSIIPVAKANIPVNVRNTFNPLANGTMIVPERTSRPSRAVTGIAGKKGFVAISVEKAMMNNMPGFARRVLSVLERHGVSLEHMPTGIDTLSAVMDGQNLSGDELERIIDEIKVETEPDSLEVTRDLALLTIVGHGMMRRKGTAGRLFSALAKADVNILMVDSGSSELNIIVGIAAKDFERAIHAAYKEFFVNSPGQKRLHAALHPRKNKG